LEVLSTALGVTPAEFVRSLAPREGVIIPILTGLVVLADWLASDESFLSFSPLEKLTENPQDYLLARKAQALNSVYEQLGHSAKKSGDFKGLFAFDADRPVQRWVENVDHGPGLTIVAVPAGEGKTEPALWIHSARTDLNEGLMFALPTTATADAMFERVQSFYKGTDALANITHGRAILNAFYAGSGAQPTNICGEDSNDADPAIGLRPSSWFSGRHRGLTAPITVGTCDQVLAASLSHKFLPVRLTSLANKHVILDEIHTYDPYQQRLLVRLLGWLGFYHSRVTLLSATLPRQRLVECMDAYLDGWNRFSNPRPSMKDQLDFEYPGVVRTTPEGGIEVIKLKSYREYTHEIDVLSIEGIDDTFNQGTAELADKFWNPDTCKRVGVIVNTVDRAQRITRVLREMGHDALLLHSRMTANQRARATDALMHACGKNTSGGAVMLVSTQIAEASLDIDLDLLITDIAPMASLIQRFGRQWRHSKRGSDGVWKHPEHLWYRSGNPRAFVLVPRDDNGALHPRAHYPYTRAEINKTLQEAEALDQGNRRGLQIPGDIQAAVDAANVSWEDLVKGEDESLTELMGHLAKVSSAIQSAKLAGVDAKSLATSWRQDGDWEDNSTLYQLTVGTLWHEEAVTRLREAETVQLLVCDPSGANDLAWFGTTESILAVHELERIKEVLSYVIPVSGALARELRAVASPLIPAGWDNQSSALIQSLLPISITSLEEIAELGIDGLVKIETRNK
jgi:CRISPR-associated endonuclease/helicase Cas3